MTLTQRQIHYIVASVYSLLVVAASWPVLQLLARLPSTVDPHAAHGLGSPALLDESVSDLKEHDALQLDSVEIGAFVLFGEGERCPVQPGHALPLRLFAPVGIAALHKVPHPARATEPAVRRIRHFVEGVDH
ncbi:MAG: hypothetical protein CME24_04115, partial [Gemmatimonadetes bacterium]|nr:hypothetical protein [Gemmatimonadota bacterium]